ncbi:MAG TPA: hypothetical protein VIL00_15140 [Pseudonocardiaceae bacterium]
MFIAFRRLQPMTAEEIAEWERRMAPLRSRSLRDELRTALRRIPARMAWLLGTGQLR